MRGDFLSATRLLHVVGEGRGEEFVQTDLIYDSGRNRVAQEFVEIQPGEAGLLLSGGNIALVLAQLNFIALLGIREISQGGLILDFLLDNLLLEIGTIQFDQDLVSSDVLVGNEIALIHDPENLSALIADADLAFYFLRFESLKAAALEHADFERTATGREGRGLAGGPAVAAPEQQAQQHERSCAGHPAPGRLLAKDYDKIIELLHV